MLTNNCTGRKENLKDWVGLMDILETDIYHSTFKQSENNTSCLKIAIFSFALRSKAKLKGLLCQWLSEDLIEFTIDGLFPF